MTVDNGILAGYASDILNNISCSSYPESDNHQVQGQALDVAGWNVIVGLGVVTLASPPLADHVFWFPAFPPFGELKREVDMDSDFAKPDTSTHS